MGSHPTTNKPQEIPGTSRILNPPTTSAPRRPRSEIETSSKPKRRIYKKETANKMVERENTKDSNKKSKGTTTTEIQTSKGRQKAQE